ncbi:hypothetical protein P0F19_002345 [Vibrio metschnikovii]|uniref:AfsA-related hotdog domain-containing protein n=1 Tax=Vibrio metschnikovii TaxID=28172 RepID=UPI001C2F3EC2|nr:AfsA-related hotdog domain-containing protein [Vibrio metschnikovii]EKO3877136.1 hypothetical protein [Vibrio metschnikovii]
MKIKKIVVVGDKFHEFSDSKDVVTTSQLELLTQIPTKILDNEHEIILGQGVRKDFARKILSNHKKNAFCKNKFKICSLEKFVNDKSNVNSHKKQDENILIGASEPVEHKNNLYVMPLIIDERCELMSDHQTGQHIQGMLLVEAGRQAFIAVTEEWIYSKEVGRYYVINEMAINFSNFVFPLPALIHFEFFEKDINDRRGRFKGQVRVTQNQTVCATMDVSFTVYPSSMIYKKEKDLADVAVNTALLNVVTEIQQVAHA